MHRHASGKAKMALITWREDYRVGVAMIDSEHQYLFALINEFHDRYVAGRSRRDLVVVLTRLVAYAETHFQHEQALMHSERYPNLEHHIGEHEKLYSSIYQLNEQLARNALSVDRETLRFLKHWLVDHILHEDLAVGRYFGTRSAGDAQPGAARAEAGTAADEVETATQGE
jgi:hemerythrin